MLRLSDLRVPGIRAALEQRRVPCIAVSPIIGGEAVKVRQQANDELALVASVAGLPRTTES